MISECQHVSASHGDWRLAGLIWCNVREFFLSDAHGPDARVTQYRMTGVSIFETVAFGAQA